MCRRKPLLRRLRLLFSSCIPFYVVALLLFFGEWGETIEIQEKVFGLNLVRSLGGNQEVSDKVALTFDDAPNGYTEKILDVLRDEKIKATFFLIGSQVKRYPEVAKRIVQQGHEVGNHSYSHRIDENFTLEEILQDLRQAEKVIRDVTGCVPSYFRPPRGFTNGKIEEACGLLGYSIILWWVDSKDWQVEESEILEEVVSHLRPGSVLLFHSLPQTAQVLPQLIKALREKGYALVTVSELLEE